MSATCPYCKQDSLKAYGPTADFDSDDPTKEGYIGTCGVHCTNKDCPGPFPDRCKDCDGTGQQWVVVKKPEVGLSWLERREPGGIVKCASCNGTGERGDGTKQG